MKKVLPIGLKELLDDTFKDTNDLICHNFQENLIISIEEKNYDGDYHFNIVKIIPQIDDSNNYIISYKPCSENTLRHLKIEVNSEDLYKHLVNWKNLLVKSNKKSIVFEDPIAQCYYEELEPKFKDFNPDNSKPYTIKQQIDIILLLERSKALINHYKTDYFSETETIIDIINYTRLNITKMTQKEVINNIRKIVTYAFKISLDLGQNLLFELTMKLKIILNISNNILN